MIFCLLATAILFTTINLRSVTVTVDPKSVSSSSSSPLQAKDVPEVLPNDIIYSRNARSTFVIPVSFYIISQSNI